MLNMLAPELAPIVHAIFTQSLDTGELPRDWSLANVAPIFKKGNRVLAENYRPVSLTCITCKLFKHIVCRHILDHVEDHKILANLQHGFCSGRCCETQLITTTHDLLSSFNSKSQIDVAIYFSKAFNPVPHAGLHGKLEHYGIGSKILLWITNFLNNRLETGNKKPFWKYLRVEKQEDFGISALKSNGTLFTDRKPITNRATFRIDFFISLIVLVKY